MEKLNVLSIPFFKFKVEKNIQEEIFDVVQKLNYIKDGKIERGHIFHDFYHEGLFNFFDNSIKQVQNIYFNDDLTFPIVDCWVNKYTTLTYLHKHSHSNSIICGCYYVTDHDNLNTIFETQNPWNVVTHSHQTSILKINKNNNPLSGEVK